MELKDFVCTTIVDICNGVKEAQDKCKDNGALVNPMLSVAVCNKETYRHNDKDYPATSINFKVGLTETTKEDGKNGIGVFLGKVSLGHESEKGASVQTVTSVEFSVVAVLPYIDRQGKHVPLSYIL